MSRVRRAFLRLGLVMVLAGSMVAAGVLSDRAPVFAQAQVPGYPVSQSAAIGTAGGGPVIYGLTGQNVCSVDVSGTWSGTLSVQGSTQWASVQVTPLNSSTAQTGITANGVFIANVGGLNQVRVTGPAGSGSATVYLTCFFAPGFSTLAKAVTLVSPLPLPVSVSPLPLPVSVSAPTDGAGNVNVNCEVGCAGSATPTPFATVAPHILQVAGASGALTQDANGNLIVLGPTAGPATPVAVATNVEFTPVPLCTATCVIRTAGGVNNSATNGCVLQLLTAATFTSAALIRVVSVPSVASANMAGNFLFPLAPNGVGSTTGIYVNAVTVLGGSTNCGTGVSAYGDRN